MRTGSLVNELSGSTAATPVVGLGATYLGWTDRAPYTIIAVSPDGKTLTVQADKYDRTDDNGMSESQKYTYSPNPGGETYIATLRKNGAWVVKGESLKKGKRFAVGYRERYYDFSF